MNQVQIADRGVQSPQPLEQLIVQHHDFPVPGAAQVELDHVCPECHRRREGGQRVLPLAHRFAAVGDGGDVTRRRRRPHPRRWR